jgi:glycosyltransferase involved in cell wall biosynthesis
MDLAVVIPSFETPIKILKRSIESILQQVDSDSVEIIVVDSSLQALPEELTHFQSHVRFFFPKRRMFAGEARNFGASQTSKEFLAFLDSDCFWQPLWFQTAKALVTQHPDGLAFCGQIFFEDLSQDWALALHIMEFHEFLALRRARRKFLPSGNLLIRSSFFRSIGGFESHWPACEDIGFLRSINQSIEFQSKIHFEPNLAVTHTSHLTSEALIKQKAHFMGYWRGFYDSELPSPFQVSSKKIFTVLKPFLGTIFFMLILKRSLQLKSCYLAYLFKHSFRVMILTRIWARGFREGCEQKNKPART